MLREKQIGFLRPYTGLQSKITLFEPKKQDEAITFILLNSLDYGTVQLSDCAFHKFFLSSKGLYGVGSFMNSMNSARLLGSKV